MVEQSQWFDEKECVSVRNIKCDGLTNGWAIYLKQYGWATNMV